MVELTEDDTMKQIEDLKAENEQLKKENSALRRILDQLQTDSMLFSNSIIQIQQFANQLPLKLRSASIDPLKYVEQVMNNATPGAGS